MNLKQKKLIECIRLHSDIVDFGTKSDAVDDYWIDKAEHYLNVKLPDSYIWFLKNYSGGEISGDEIYSIYGMEFEDINGGDIVFQHLTNKKNYLTEPDRIVVNETDLGEVFFFNYKEFDGKEAPIYLKLPSGQTQLYANNFYDFLIQRIEAYIH